MGDDFHKLGKWVRLLRLGDAVVLVIREKMITTARELIDDGFQQQRDPYGKRWAKKKRPDGRPILQGRTLRLRSGWHPMRIGNRKFVIVPSVPYAAYHQAPRNRSRPRRRMVPTGKRKLPPLWEKKLKRAAVGGFWAYLTGKRVKTL